MSGTICLFDTVHTGSPIIYYANQVKHTCTRSFKFIEIKSDETRDITYMCSYTSGHLICASVVAIDKL